MCSVDGDILMKTMILTSINTQAKEHMAKREEYQIKRMEKRTIETLPQLTVQPARYYDIIPGVELRPGTLPTTFNITLTRKKSVHCYREFELAIRTRHV